MSYILPSSYKCVDCGHEFKFTPHESHPAPVLQQEIETAQGICTRSLPVCPVCWTNFLMKNVGIGYSTEQWRPEGSDYSQAMRARGQA